MTTESSASHRSHRSRTVWAAVGVLSLVFAVALGVRLLGLGQEPLKDELYNYLAARGFMDRGVFEIVPGAEPYTRGWQITWLSARLMELLGTDLWVARLPTAVLGGALALLVAAWLVRRGHVLAALIAGLLVAFDPHHIQLSQVVRFYALQILAFFLGAVCILEALEPRRRHWVRGALLAMAVTLLVLAIDLQIVSIIGFGGILLYLAVELVLQARRMGRTRQLVLGSLAMVVVGALSARLVLGPDPVERALSLATYADLWAEGRADNLRYYYAHLHDLYAPLISFLPLFALLALLADARTAGLAFCVLVVAWPLQSMMAWKDMRYIGYTMPFFFTLSGLGVVEGGRRLHRWLVAMRTPVRIGRAWTAVILATMAVSLIIGNRMILATGRLLTRPPEQNFPWNNPRGQPLMWTTAEPRLRELAEAHEVVVATDPLKAIHFVGRVDYALTRHELFDRSGWSPEYTLDTRVNAPTISTAESLREVRACHASGLVLAERLVFGNGAFVIPEVRELLESEFEPVDLPREWGIMVFRWADGQVRPEACVRGPAEAPGP